MGVGCVRAGAQVGITYGRNAENLPTPSQVAGFPTQNLNYSIPILRLLDADLQVLQAFRRSNLVLTVTLPSDQIPSVPLNRRRQRAHPRPRRLIGGPGHEKPSHQALISNKVPYDVKVTTSVSPKVLGKSYPPSAGQFEDSVSNFMTDVTNFLHSIGAPLLINAYPYSALVNDPQHVALEPVLFQAKKPLVIDGEPEYFNLFDVMVDAFVAAAAKVVGREGVRVVVSETGWPVKGNEPYTCVENARNYNRNLKDHVERVGGTPRMTNYLEN
ncbi:glucan endo-1,3-beta-glucosidase-like [Prosopis cineraria]|uniref:glucan endo-1,3-beta-glucosidase-like n=1 Tax=Prosopis cineraria TaxID=364024 RepID=UPI00240FD0DE|nr:glucan endo-1,3-beta-glucosidase-like [Prosopis cineraria]